MVVFTTLAFWLILVLVTVVAFTLGAFVCYKYLKFTYVEIDPALRKEAGSYVQDFWLLAREHHWADLEQAGKKAGLFFKRHPHLKLDTNEERFERQKEILSAFVKSEKIEISPEAVINLAIRVGMPWLPSEIKSARKGHFVD